MSILPTSCDTWARAKPVRARLREACSGLVMMATIQIPTPMIINDMAITSVSIDTRECMRLFMGYPAGRLTAVCNDRSKGCASWITDRHSPVSFLRDGFPILSRLRWAEVCCIRENR
jgi:hypothetical protein